jgi:predicted DCC family thiol-disulfide oxidoreductase YuxK
MRDSVINLALTGPTLIIDGQCNLCHSASGFIATRTAQDKTFLFLWAQHPDTISLLDKKFQVSEQDIMKSWALLVDDRIYRGAEAWLKATTFMKQPWRMLGRLGGFVPACVQDSIYALVAHNRYNWFGGADVCIRPVAGAFLHDLE